jgi:hypothetical protein
MYASELRRRKNLSMVIAAEIRQLTRWSSGMRAIPVPA